MDMLQKIELLGASAQYDVCIACGTHANRRTDDLGRWIYPAALPDGRRIAQLKVLQTNVCQNNCFYCAQRAGRDSQRTQFTPDELAKAFADLHRRGLVAGLFLSSGVSGDAGRSMDRMLATVELLRKRYRFQGYVHLKMLPGISMAHVEQAVRLADRVSVNLEAPAQEYLSRIAPEKRYEDLTNPMLAQIPHVRLAAHVGTIAGVETNAMQFYPQASAPEAAVHPGLYQRREGCVDLSTVRGAGFGYRLDEIRRALPAPAAECAG